MTYDFIEFDRESDIPLYQQLYTSISKAIENGNLPQGTKLPSIRKLSEDLELSRTTVESAYQQLCVEGFIVSKPQNGYYVHIDVLLTAKKKSSQHLPQKHTRNENQILYNLGSDSIDRESADIKLWRSHIKDVLKKQNVIVSYGESQGESALRNALSFYSYALRGVLCRAENIVIGAGTQPLLYILCGLIRDYGNCIAIEKGGFSKAEQVFHDCGLEVVHINSDKNEIRINELYEKNVKLFFVNPSGNLTTGQPMKMNQRYELLFWAEQSGGMIIEDDYNGELRYTSRPIPALQGINSDRVIYMGSFSKLLLPSVRIGYMVLPEMLLDIYRKKSELYNQTASKIEQLALARYINEGQLDRQLRRLRKIYAEKCTVLTESIQSFFGNNVKMVLNENSLCITLTLNNNGKDIEKEALKKGVKVTHIRSERTDEYVLRLGFAGIPVEDIEPAVRILREIYTT